MTTAGIIRSARRASGLSQRALAERSGLPQPTIASFEAESRGITADTLARLIHGLGYQISLLPAGYLTAANAATLVSETSRREGPARAEIHVLQLADDLAAAPPALRAALVVAPPASTGDRHFDAWIAGLVEYRLSEVGIPAPDWVYGADKVSPDEWAVGGVGPDLARPTTPEPLLRRRVLLSADDLVSV